jgi:hypothetical protein
MIMNKLIREVLKKHGTITIEKTKSTFGEFQITTYCKGNKEIPAITVCFDLEDGFIGHLAIDKE